MGSRFPKQNVPPETMCIIVQIAARALAMYLIPGCVGRGVRLGSEGSSVGGGGGVGGGVWKFGVQKMKKKISKFKSVLPKMLARSGLVGKKSSWPYLGPSEAIFSIGRKNPKIAQKLPIFLGGPMGPIHAVWALAAIHPRWGNRYG